MCECEMEKGRQAAEEAHSSLIGSGQSGCVLLPRLNHTTFLSVPVRL